MLPLNERDIFIRKSELVRLAVGNINVSWRRAVPLLALIVGCVSVGMYLGPYDLHRHLAEDANREQAGSNIFIARSEHGIDPDLCESLSKTNAVKTSGWLRDEGSTEVRPGVNVPKSTISSGFARLIGGKIYTQDLYGYGLAERLEIHPRADNVIQEMGMRTELLSSSVLTIGVGTKLADDCWVEATRKDHKQVSDIVVSTLLVGSPDLTVKSLTFDSGPEAYDHKLFNYSGLLGGMLAGLAGGLQIRLRRIDLSMYRLLGFSSADARFVVLTEILLLYIFSFATASTGWLFQIAATSPVSRPVILGLLWTLGTMSVTASIVLLLMMRFVSRSSAHLATLREGM